MREGIIIRLTDGVGNLGWGEIAPIPWFGSETLAQAKNFCCQIGKAITAVDIEAIPDSLPACQFAFESALAFFTSPSLPLVSSSFDYSYLLPTGEAALRAWQTTWQQGGKTFKWKIGVSSLMEEIKIFQQLRQALPSRAKLRLDANGGLKRSEAQEWLKVCDEVGGVEFLEQPLAPGKMDEMLDLTTQYNTSLALDESVATLTQLRICYQQGWRSIYIIKPAIAGSPQLLRNFCQQHSLDTVFSSALETSIGRKAALNLAKELSSPHRALGFGVNHWFSDNEDTWCKNQ